MRKICFDEDHGHADLPLQRVQIGGHVVLFIAQINHDLRTGGQNGFQIQRRFAAIHLAGRRQINQARVEIFILARRRRCVDGRHVFGRNGRQKHRRDCTARGHARERFGNIDRPTERVRKGYSRLCRFRLPLRRAAGQAPAHERQRQQKRKKFFISHGYPPKKIAFGKAVPAGAASARIIPAAEWDCNGAFRNFKQKMIKFRIAERTGPRRAANARRGPANVRCGCGEEMSEMSERMTRNWNEQVPHASAHSAVRFSKLIIPS